MYTTVLTLPGTCLNGHVHPPRPKCALHAALVIPAHTAIDTLTGMLCMVAMADVVIA